MKILRVILIVLGLLLVITQLYFIIALAIDPKSITKEPYDFWNYFFGPSLFFLMGVLLLFIAYRINKKIKKRKAMDLIKSLPD